MTNNINLIDINSACNSNASASTIIKKLKLQTYDILISCTGLIKSNEIRIILRFDAVMLTAYIKLKKNMYEGRVGDYKVIDGWQLKILR